MRIRVHFKDGAGVRRPVERRALSITTGSAWPGFGTFLLRGTSAICENSEAVHSTIVEVGTIL
jgi:hypothetical protein